MFKFALPIDVLGMAFEFLVYAFALFGFRILNLVLLAQRTAIQQLRAGMLVLDPQGRVASLNSMAERIFRLPASQLLGQPVQTLLPDYPDELLATFLEAEIELCLKRAGENRPLHPGDLSPERLAAAWGGWTLADDARCHRTKAVPGADSWSSSGHWRC